MFVLLSLLLAPPAQEPIALAWKLKPGDRFYVEEIQNARQTIVSGNESRHEIHQTAIFRYTVVSMAKNGDVTLEKKIDRIKSPDKMLRALEGAVFRLVVTRKGSVAQIDGYDNFLTRLAAEDAVTARLVRANHSEDSLKVLTETLFQCIPDRPVTKKDRWRRFSRISLGSVGTMQAKNTYTLLGEDDANKNLVKIGVTTELAYVVPAKDPVREGLIRSEEAGGTLWFNPRLGRLDHAEMRQALKGKLTLANAVVEIEQHQTTKIRILEKSPLETK